MSSAILIPVNTQRRFSIFANNFDNEFQHQPHVQIIDSKISQPYPTRDGSAHRRRLTQIISVVEEEQDEEEVTVKPKGFYLLLFILEPFLTGCILFPLLVLFWDCGWNLITTMLNALNNYSLTYNLDGLNYTDYDYGVYSPESLVVTYIIDQVLFLIMYLGQDIFYDFLKKQHSIISTILIKIHIFILAFLYIIQWEMMWTIIDQYTPQDWPFMFIFSLGAIFVLMALTGTLSDLVCSPFIISYDSIDYCIQFECPLMTEDMSRWKINLMNYIFYELFISTITIVAWHGFYVILDQYLYPNEIEKSIWICLVIGYPLYFPLMYGQYFLEKIAIKWKFWSIFLSNFPQFHRNLVHSLAFASCVFLWRGFWVLYDTYLRIFQKYHDTYLLVACLVFLVLSTVQTFSSMNGPLKTMEDKYQFFPVYPHCYVSKVVYQFIQMKKKMQRKKIFPNEQVKNQT